MKNLQHCFGYRNFSSFLAKRLVFQETSRDRASQTIETKNDITKTPPDVATAEGRKVFYAKVDDKIRELQSDPQNADNMKRAERLAKTLKAARDEEIDPLSEGGPQQMANILFRSLKRIFQPQGNSMSDAKAQSILSELASVSAEESQRISKIGVNKNKRSS